LSLNIDELAKSRKILFSVIPAEAGIQSLQGFLNSRLRGSDDLGAFYESINIDQSVFSITTRVETQRSLSNVQ